MDKTKEVQVKVCLRCGHEWTPHVEHPLQCPKCHQTGWDTYARGSGRPRSVLS